MQDRIIWSPLAEKDFFCILDYLQNKWGESVLQTFLDLTESVINQIELNPKQFPLIHRKKRIRKCVITKHNTLFYRVERKSIFILRIYDTRQDPQKLIFL
jgi:plasmid stabilization system protein ParE